MKKLRSGYTTGACAAAAAKGATLNLLGGGVADRVEIPFPGGKRVFFSIINSSFDGNLGRASVIKDGGDDPDVTNGAEIGAEARFGSNRESEEEFPVVIKGGKGVGVVTKPGLPVAVGNPAINPVPLQMIRDAVKEALGSGPAPGDRIVEITIFVPHGEELAKNTLNRRLGIIGGISILGTTGIVRPVSAEAWTATIATSMDVASAAGLQEIVLSTGRSSEKAVQKHLGLPDEALVMMGDYLEFALKQSKQHRYEIVHMATMWAKLVKGSMGISQTHVRHGVLGVADIMYFFREIGVENSVIEDTKSSNTAREVLDRLLACESHEVINQVCARAKKNYGAITDARVKIHLVHSSGNIICSV